METLGKLFGSIARVKLMKFFMMHEAEAVDKDSIKKITKIQAQTLTKELKLLEKVGFLKQRKVYIELKKKNKNGTPKKKKVVGYEVDSYFRYLSPLKNLLCSEAAMRHQDLNKFLSPIGKIKVIIASGIFVQDPDGRVDILVAGDGISEARVKKAIGAIESEIGKEVRYACFETEDFKYRIGICDRLVRDVFDYPHQVIVDRIGIQ